MRTLQIIIILLCMRTLQIIIILLCMHITMVCKPVHK